MTTDTDIKTGIEVHLDDGDLLLYVTDGYHKVFVLRYPLAPGTGTLAHDSDGPRISAGDLFVACGRVSHYVSVSDNAHWSRPRMIFSNIPIETVTEIAEILLGGPLPGAPHKCAVEGCDHGHAA